MWICTHVCVHGSIQALTHTSERVRIRRSDTVLERYTVSSPWARCEQADSVRLLKSLTHIPHDRLRRDRHL